MNTDDASFLHPLCSPCLLAAAFDGVCRRGGEWLCWRRRERAVSLFARLTSRMQRLFALRGHRAFRSWSTASKKSFGVLESSTSSSSGAFAQW